MISFPTSTHNYQVQFYSSKRIASPPENNRHTEFPLPESAERKIPHNTKLILKKPIQVLINEGFFSKKLQENTQEKSYPEEKNDFFRKTTEGRFKTYGAPSEAKNVTSSTRSRIEELINDSKQLIFQGSKMLFDEKESKKEQKYMFQQSNYQEKSVTKTATKEFRRFENTDDETPKKKDAFKEFQRLEGKLKELETKIKVLKSKRIEHTSPMNAPYNPSASEHRPYSPQESKNKSPSNMDYSSLLQNIVTQVPAHSILPKSSLLNPKVNEKFQNLRQPIMKYEKSPLIKRCEDHRYYIDSALQAYANPKSQDRDSWTDHFWQTMQCINFVKGIEHPSANIHKQKLLTLPKRSIYWRKKTIIFDLDETLVHCNENPDMPCDIVLKINFGNGLDLEAGINLRPYLRECLKELSQYYELMVFTASHESYANGVVDYIDPNHEFIQHRLSREQCFLTTDGLFIKDLRVIGNRNLEEILLVDNAAYSFGFQLGNGIPILPFYNDKNDQELLRLTEYLIGLKECQDIRRKNKEYFKLDQYHGFKDPLELLSTLYKVNS